jgi:hypothetical protein
MASFGSSNGSGNKVLQTFLRTEASFVKDTEALRGWAGVLEVTVVHDNSDGASRQTGAYFHGMAEAFRRCGRPCEVITALQPNAKAYKRPNRAWILIDQASFQEVVRRLSDLGAAIRPVMEA